MSSPPASLQRAVSPEPLNPQPAEPPPDGLAFELARASRLLERRVDQALRTYGLSARQLAAMTYVDRNPRLSRADLAKVLQTTPQAAGGLIQRMVDAGFVNRTYPEAGRALRLELTAEGRVALTAATSAAAAAEAAAVRNLPLPDREMLPVSLWLLARDLSEYD